MIKNIKVYIHFISLHKNSNHVNCII